MLWLCICLPRLPFDALSLSDAELSVVTLVDGRVRCIVTGSRAAERLGFVRGMDYATASTLCANLNAVERNPRAERRALERLAAWAYQWSSFVTLHLADPKSLREHSAIWVEIAGSFKLFGGCGALLEKIERELAPLNYDYLLGVAYSLEGAALLARAQRRVVANSEAALRRQMATLPLALLSLPEAAIFELDRAGVRTIGALLDLPKDGIARRFGPQVIDYLDRLLGAPDPRPAFQLPKKYRARCELGVEVANTEALLFPLRRMFGELQGYLRAIDGGVQRFVVHLKHRQGATRFAVDMSAPDNNAERFFALVRERLERLSLPAAVLAIGLQADHFTPPTVRQSELFAGARQSTEQFQHVLDKLIARLGGGAVQGCAPVADHRPEKSWNVCKPDATVAIDTTIAPRPLWLLAEPRRIEPPAQRLGAMERIEGGWWDGGDVRRDYYFVRDANGASCWVYRDHGRNEWFLHGVRG